TTTCSSPTATTVATWSPTTVGPYVSSSPNSTPGKAPNGCAASNSWPRTGGGFGKCTATTTVVTRGTKSVTAIRKKDKKSNVTSPPPFIYVLRLPFYATHG